MKVRRHMKIQGWGQWRRYVRRNLFHFHDWQPDEYDLPTGGWVPAGFTCSKCDGNSGPNKPLKWGLFHDYP